VAREMKEALENGQLDGVAARLMRSQQMDAFEDEFPVPLGVEFEGSTEKEAKELFMSNDNDFEEEEDEDESDKDDEGDFK